jgi:RNA chaperone Hfq
MPARTSVGRDFQDRVLGRLCESGQLATIYLRNRMALRGRVLQFDAYVVLFAPQEGGPAQLLYKSSLVSVSSMRRGGGRTGGSQGRPAPAGRAQPAPLPADPEPAADD